MRIFTYTVMFVVVVLIAVPITGNAQFVFGVKPNEFVQSSYFGINMQNIVPFGGLDLVWVSAEGTYKEEDSWSDSWGSGKTVEKDEYSGSAVLFIPHFGMKMFFGTNDVRPYILGDFFFSIPSVSFEGSEERKRWQDGVLVYDEDEDMELDDEVLDAIEDILGFWGITLGFGAEYFFTDNFSLGGEFGMRYIANSVEVSEKDEDHDPYYDYEEEWKQEISGSLKMSYATFSLNYYF